MNALRTIAAVMSGFILFAVAGMLVVGQVMGREGPLIVVLGFVALALVFGWLVTQSESMWSAVVARREPRAAADAER